jgi:hypothetical protein
MLAKVGEPNSAGMIASHWRRADGQDATGQCLIWAELADTDARRALAYDEAIRYAELAVDCVQRAGGDDSERARLLVRLAEAQFLANAVERSMASSAAAADLAESAGRADLLAQAGLSYMASARAYRTIAGSASGLWPYFHPTSTPPARACTRRSPLGSPSARAAHVLRRWHRRR